MKSNLWLPGVRGDRDKFGRLGLSYTHCVCLVTQLCLTLCDPMDCSSPGSSVHGILQERIWKWVAIPSPGDLLDSEIEPESPALQVDYLPSRPPEKLHIYTTVYIKQITNKDLLYCTGNSTQYSVMTYMGKKIPKRVDICIIESLCYIAESYIAL